MKKKKTGGRIRRGGIDKEVCREGKVGVQNWGETEWLVDKIGKETSMYGEAKRKGGSSHSDPWPLE